MPAEEASAESMMCESERAMSTRRDGAPEVGKGLCADCYVGGWLPWVALAGGGR